MTSELITHYKKHLKTVEEALEALTQFVETSKAVDKAKLDWGDVGSMEYLADKMSDINDMLEGKGEYALDCSGCDWN